MTSGGTFRDMDKQFGAKKTEQASGLSAHVREEIDHWLAKFPEDRRRSAIIAALHAAQHENGGFLTRELMEEVAAYLGLPPIQVQWPPLMSRRVGRHNISVCITSPAC